MALQNFIASGFRSLVRLSVKMTSRTAGQNGSAEHNDEQKVLMLGRNVEDHKLPCRMPAMHTASADSL
jgi:hypothetical protein